MSPEHYQIIISDLYEENYKSNFAKDLRENIDDLTDFDWIYQFCFNRGGGGGVGGVSSAGSVVGGGGGVGGVSSAGSVVGGVVGGVGSGGIGVGSVGGVGVGGDN